jgi:hypothetical protein
MAIGYAMARLRITLLFCFQITYIFKVEQWRTGYVYGLCEEFKFESGITMRTKLNRSLFTTAWRVLRLRMVETASRFGG